MYGVAASCILLNIPPALLFYRLSLPTMIQAGFLTIVLYYGLQLSRMIKSPKGTRAIRLLQLRGNVSLLYNIDSYFITQRFPSRGCPYFPTFTTASMRDTPLEYSMLLRVCALYASDLHLPSLGIARSDIRPPAASVVPPPICNGCTADSSGSRPEFATTSFIARRTRS